MQRSRRREAANAAAARPTCKPGGRRRRRRAACTLTLLAAVAAIVAAVPGGAVADQASQPSSPAAGQIATGSSHSCAVVAAAVRCWGYGGDAQLGYGDRESIGDDETPDAAGPVALGPGPTVKAISAGTVHTCALLDNGTVRCWGFGADGRLGYGNTNTIGDDEAPASAGRVFLGEEAGVPLTATAISAGNGHTCALLVNGAVRCWGFNLDGRLGLGHTNTIGDNELPGSVAPVNLGAGRTAKAISAGGFHTCALLDDDTVRCWGFGGNGRLGYGNTRNIGREPPRPGDPDATPPILPVESVENAGPVFLGTAGGVPLTAKAISAGYGHTCAVLSNDTVRCWGFNGSGRLGYGNTSSVGDDELPGSVAPVDLGQGRTATAIDAGEQHTCAVLDNGRVRCWGWNAFAQLGDGTTNSVGDNEAPGSLDPVDVGPGTATAVSAGDRHSCAQLGDGSVRCWGYGANGRLGYCAQTTIGDDELPGSVGPVALGQPGIPGTSCPGAGVSPHPVAGAPPQAVVVDAAAPPPAQADPLGAALAAQQARASALRGCGRDVARRLLADRRRARGLPASRRLGARRRANRVAALGRAACLKRHGRSPGRVVGLEAAPGNGRILLSFRVAGTEGSKPPAARRYLVKQSLRPIRTARDFARAPQLCRGACTFDVTRLDATATLSITDLRRSRLYHYAVAALDNVSGRRGPRSQTVSARAG